MRVKIYYIAFLCFCIIWAITTTLCYCGIIVFDSRTLGGSMLSGLVLSASFLSMIALLKILFDQFWDRISKDLDEA